MTTYAAFVSALVGLTVTGVKRKFAAPPTQLNTADLPAMYPRIPQAAEGGLTAEGQGGWPRLTGELVFVIEPIGQSRQPSNFAATVTMIDAINTTLRAATLTKSKHSWTVRREGVNLGGDTDYWALVATVIGNG